MDNYFFTVVFVIFPLGYNGDRDKEYNYKIRSPSKRDAFRELRDRINSPVKLKYVEVNGKSIKFDPEFVIIPS